MNKQRWTRGLVQRSQAKVERKGVQRENKETEHTHSHEI